MRTTPPGRTNEDPGRHLQTVVVCAARRCRHEHHRCGDGVARRRIRPTSVGSPSTPRKVCAELGSTISATRRGFPLGHDGPR